MREISIEGGGHFWNSLAAALAVSPADLLYWDKFGASQQLLLEDAEAAEEIDDPGLFVSFSKLPSANFEPQLGNVITSQNLLDLETAQYPWMQTGTVWLRFSLSLGVMPICQ